MKKVIFGIVIAGVMALNFAYNFQPTQLSNYTDLELIIQNAQADSESGSEWCLGPEDDICFIDSTWYWDMVYVSS